MCQRAVLDLGADCKVKQDDYERARKYRRSGRFRD
jgi:hypothetical protein